MIKIPALLLAITLLTHAAPPIQNIPYHPVDSKIPDPQNRCLLDLKIPPDTKNFPTLIWFHGGGLTSGEKHFPQITGNGIALIAAGYRLAPQAQCPDFLTDAAAATAWTLKNIQQYGGDPAKIFVGGHSAGGYLAAMIGMDPKWLATHGYKPTQLAGLIPLSAQATTHFHVKQLRNIPGPPLKPVIDDFAPLQHVSKDLPPICLILGDRSIEFECRVEENEFLAITLKKLGHPHIEFHELKNLDHNTVTQGAAPHIPAFIQRVTTKP
jgi:acetyl esterase/lipase